MLGAQEPVVGRSARLTIDIVLQQSIEAAFAETTLHDSKGKVIPGEEAVVQHRAGARCRK